MLDQYVAQWRGKAQTFGARSFDGLAWKRTEHGGSAWLRRPEAEQLRQPQDGAQDLAAEGRGRVAEIRSHLHRAFVGEPEDARLTGGTRSLMRRVMGLNVASPQPPVRQTPAVALTRPRATRVATVRSEAQVA